MVITGSGNGCSLRMGAQNQHHEAENEHANSLEMLTAAMMFFCTFQRQISPVAAIGVLADVIMHQLPLLSDRCLDDRLEWLQMREYAVVVVLRECRELAFVYKRTELILE